MALKFDFDEALRNLIHQVDEKLQASCSKNEPLTDWLLAFPAKAKQKLVSNEGFKMPKTPGRKKAVRQQKKRVLNEGDANQEASNEVPQTKRGKLFHEEEDLLRESVDGGRPRRQASNAAKSKIQKSLKMMNLTQKLRRPAGEDEANGEDHNTSVNQPPTIEEESTSPVLPRARQSVRNQQDSAVASTSTTIPDDPPETVNSKVQFAPEPQWREPESEEATAEEPKDVEAEAPPPPPVEEVVQVEPPKKGRTRKLKVPEAASTSEEPEEQPVETASRTRKPRKAAEVIDVEPVVNEKPCPASRKTKKSDVVPEVVSPSVSQKQKKSKESHSNEKETIVADKEEENKVSIIEEPQEQPAAEPAPKTRKTKKVPEVVEVEEVVREKPCPASRKTKKNDDVSEDCVSPSSSQMKKRSKESYSNEKETIGLPEEVIQGLTATKKASVEPVEVVPVRSSLRRKISTEIGATSEVQVVQEAPETNGTIPKKVASKSKKPAKEPKSSAAMPPPVASPRGTRLSKAVREPPVTPSRRNLLEQASKFTSPTSSPARKPFLVFSPFKSSSVKTKVEAFEAVLGSGGGARESRQSKAQSTVLPEARVLLRRLTSDDLSDAGIVPESPGMEVIASANDGTFVVEEPTKQVDKRQSISQALARKSIGKAKLTAISAARNKLANSVVHTDAPESPNVHVNRNAANLMSKFRFPNTGGSSGSSSASSARHVAMTQARALGNVVSGVTSFTTTNKPMQPLVTKSSDDESQKRKELELRRLKEKEEEAARKREELLKAKAEEQKKKHDARIKRAMEARALKAKQTDDDQKQKLESKEEKAAQLKMKLQVETQEKAERKRAEILQRQQEAEQRRKAEELQRQKEEEQQRLLKKEQEELERQTKVKIENEKTKAGAGPSTLNTTVTLTKPEELIDTYQITPVRVKKTTGKKVPNPDNYDINDMRSDDSTDDDSKPKKVIPLWARSVNVKAALANQIYNDISDTIFPAEILLLDPDLNVIFKHKRPRFDKRTSSAVWKTPPANYM